MNNEHPKTFRTGAVGALMDEYERASGELVRLVSQLTDAEFEATRDRETPDEECRSIQTVANHVVGSGYAYADYLRAAFGLEGSRPEVPLGTRAEIGEQLAAMLAYTVATLDGWWQMPYEEVSAVQIKVRCGPGYDLEQLLEHAIVHVLRHRRQIERFLSEPRFTPTEADD
jgi:uncharacterized damage-inducible protein DinB